MSPQSSFYMSTRSVRPSTSLPVSPTSSQFFPSIGTPLQESFLIRASVNRKMKMDHKYNDLIDNMKKIRVQSAVTVEKNIEKLHEGEDEYQKQKVKI